MTKVMKICPIALAFIFLTIPVSYAQEMSDTTKSDEAGFLMMNYHQCWPDKMSEVQEFSKAHLQPVLEELEKEGAIKGWGIMEHGWGDEWNWIFYMVTESHAAFVDVWQQFYEKLEARQPGFYEDIVAKNCFAHKDNMYVVTAMSQGGQ